MHFESNKLLTLAAVVILIVVGVDSYLAVGRKSSPPSEGATYQTTDQAASKAGATVAPTTPPLKVEPK